MPPRRERCVIVGSGFVGKGITNALTVARVEHVIVHAPRLTLPSLTTTVEGALALLHDPDMKETIEALASQFDGATVVINAAGVAEPDTKGSVEMLGANGLLPGVLLAAARAAKVARYIHISSAAVQGRRRILDETPETEPTSPYGASKVFGEELVSRLVAMHASTPSATQAVMVRATSIQGEGRRTSSQLQRIARSPLASVAGSGDQPSPVASLAGLAECLLRLMATDVLPPIVLQPWEGQTARSVLQQNGSRSPKRLPVIVCRLTVATAIALSRRRGDRYAGRIRRVELMWFGQAQVNGWFAQQGTECRKSENAHGQPGPILFGATAALTARVFMVEQCRYLAKSGWSVHLVSSDGPERNLSRSETFQWHTIEMKRNIAPSEDLRSLMRWLALLRSLQPRVVMVGTPKAGLLGITASFIRRTPVRIYLVRGLRAEGLTGLSKSVSLLAERVACRLATDVVAVGPSLRFEMHQRRLNGNRRIDVIGHGGSNGVDTERFRPALNDKDRVERQQLRSRLGVTDHFVVGFVGRLTMGKGIAQALAVMRNLSNATDSVRFMVVGDFENENPVSSDVIREMDEPNVVRVGRVIDTSPYYRAMDAYLHLARFEGLPNAVMEASASGLPVVTTAATGCPDVVEDGRTGFVVGLDDELAPVARLKDLCEDPRLCAMMGQNGRALVQANFSNEIVWRNLRQYLLCRTDGLTDSERMRV